MLETIMDSSLFLLTAGCGPALKSSVPPDLLAVSTKSGFGKGVRQALRAFGRVDSRGDGLYESVVYMVRKGCGAKDASRVAKRHSTSQTRIWSCEACSFS